MPAVKVTLATASTSVTPGRVGAELLDIVAVVIVTAGITPSCHCPPLWLLLSTLQSPTAC